MINRISLLAVLVLAAVLAGCVYANPYRAQRMAHLAADAADEYCQVSAVGNDLNRGEFQVTLERLTAHEITIACR